MGLPAIELNEQLSLNLKSVIRENNIDLEVANDGLPDVDRPDLLAYAYELKLGSTKLLCMHSITKKDGEFVKSHFIFMSIVGKITKEEKNLYEHVKVILIENGGEVVA